MKSILRLNRGCYVAIAFAALLVGCSKSMEAPLPATNPSTSRNSADVSTPPKADSLVGKWDWGWGDVKDEYQNKITINADGSLLSEIGGLGGKWERSGDTVTFRWANGATDTVTISADGKTLDGRSATDSPVRGRKQ
jgi:hypothetical protein